MLVAYLVSVWLHILAVSAWVGSMFFLTLVAVPWMRRGDRMLAMRFLRESAGNLRNLGWASFVVVLVTGSFNLYVRGVRFESFADPEWRSSPFGKTVLLKLAVFFIVVAMSAVHDFRIGPGATGSAVENDPARAERMRRMASVMGRTNFLLALILVALGVMIVRGMPF